MPLILEPELPTTDLIGRLEQLRRKMRWDIAIAGSTKLIAVMLAYCAIVMICDVLLHWPAPIRALFLVGGIVGLATLVQRWLIAPWKRVNDPLFQARQVEAQTPGLQESLSTIIEFLHHPVEQSTTSPQLLQATRSFAVQRSRLVDFTQAVPSHIPTALACLTLALLLLVGWFFVTSKPAVALARLFDPYGGYDWPTKTNIDVVAPAVIARGEAFWFTAKITGVIPDRLRLAVAVSESISWEQSISLTPTLEGAETVPIELEPSRVPRSFRFQLTANDATTEWRAVTVQVPPRLTALNDRPSPVMRLDYPRYTDVPSLNLPDGAGALEAVFGTQVSIAAATDRPIRSAAIQFQPIDPRVVSAVSALPFADMGPQPTIGAIASAILTTRPQSLTISGNNLQFHGYFVPMLSGNHELLFRDSDGLQGHWPIDIRIVPDPSPSILVEEPSSAGNSLELSASSTLRIRATIADTIFAIRQVAIEYRIGNAEQSRQMMLYDGDELGRIMPQLLPDAIAPESRLRPKNVVVDHGIPLSAFRRFDGSKVQPGDAITFSLIATDFDDVTPTKPPGRSTEMELRVVGTDRLAANQRQARQGFLAALQELHNWQSEALQLSQEAEAHRRSTGELRPEDRDALNRSAAIQQRIADRLGDNRDGLRAAVHRWRQQVADNPAATPSEESRANRLADELERLATEILSPIGPLLASARQETEPIPPTARNVGPLPEAVRHQRNAERSLLNLLDNANSGREVAAFAAEADALAAEQDKLNRHRDELKSNIPQGVAASILNDEHSQQLNQAKESQMQLARRAEQLARQLEERASALRSEAERETARADAFDAQNQNLVPNAAKNLEQQASQAHSKAEQLNAEASALDAAKQAAKGRTAKGDENPLHEKMTAAAESITRNQLGAAQEHQQAVSRQIDEVREALRDSTKNDGDRLSKDRRDAEKQLDELIRQQEALQDRTIAAEQQPDVLKRSQQFEKLAREQQQLADRANELAEARRREGQSSLGRELEQAANAMDRAQAKLERGESGTDEQDKALDRLDNAADQARRDRTETNEQLHRDNLIKLHERFKGFVDRQASLTAETDRLFESARQKHAWSRVLQKGLFDMARAEKDLAREIESAGDQHLANYRILNRLAKQSARSLDEILDELEKMRDNGLTKETIDADRETVRQLQSRADKRLKQLLEVLQPPKENESGGSRNPQSGPSTQQSGGDKPVPENDLISPDAQVKILRQMQADLRERVEDFRNRHPDSATWTDTDRALLELLRQEQAELIQLFAELTPDNQLQPKEKK